MAGQHDGGVADGVAHINPVQLQQRQAGRKGAGGVAVGLHEYLLHVGVPGHLRMRAQAPVVEVARHDHRRAGRDFLAHHVAQQLHLLGAVRLNQPQMHADGMHVAAMAGHFQLAVQHAAPLRAADGNVAVFKFDNRELGQHGIAVMAVVIDRIAAIGKLRPDAVGQVFVMRLVRVVLELFAMLEMASGDLLQKHHVSAHGAHRIAQLGQDELAVEKGEALVDVDRQHLEGNQRVGVRCGRLSRVEGLGRR